MAIFCVLMTFVPDFSFEIAQKEHGFTRVVGVDEAGRGPLAGPVSVAAVCFLDWDWALQSLEGLNDSKKLTEKRREALFEILTNHESVLWSLVFADAEKIDRLNILRATESAMGEAALAIEGADFTLIDGRPVKDFPLPSEGIVKGDSKSLSIAAASVIAKVSRDRQMLEWDQKYPEYGFAKHKGYGTKVHLEALKTYGPCPIHRRSFSPVAQAAAEHAGS